MKPSKEVTGMTVYASDSPYRDNPTEEQQKAGMVPLDTLPADWWNWLWEQLTTRINEAVSDLSSLFNEVLSVITDAGITPSAERVNDLLAAIKVITARYGTTGQAGAVKSSTASGKVTIEEDGTMTPNGMGTPSSLNTISKSIVGAINELNSETDDHFTTVDSLLQGLESGKADKNHASTTDVFGVGNGTAFGHLKVSDTYASSVGGVAEGVAASQKALYDAYTELKGSQGVQLGNTAGKALGTASAGTAGTAARSDHVHPIPSEVPYAQRSLGFVDASTITLDTLHYGYQHNSEPTTIIVFGEVRFWIGTTSNNRARGIVILYNDGRGYNTSDAVGVLGNPATVIAGYTSVPLMGTLTNSITGWFSSLSATGVAYIARSVIDRA